MKAFNIVFSALTVFTCFLIRPQLAEEYNGTLVLVQLMYRHGDRAPITLYPNDPHQDPDTWPDGLGQLTKRGKEMQYALGRWLRNRYKGFISEKWIPEEVYVRSTDVDRTLMSAACNLAAFYRPDDPANFFEKDLFWLPTPIHTAPLSSDMLLSVDGSCPRIQVELKRQENLPEVKNVTEHSQKLFKYLAEMSGKNVTTILDVDYLYDTLRIEALYNLTLPAWSKDVMPEMKALSDFSFEIVAMSEELKRLRAGPLIGQMGEHMRLKENGELPNQKMYMYSAHDTTLATLLLGLGVFNNKAPPYASTVLIELHKIEGQHFVKMFFRNDTRMVDPPYEIVLPGCQTLCLLDTWLALTSAVVPEDWEAECNNLNNLPFNMTVQTLSAVVVAFTLALLLLVIVTYNLMQWKQRRNFPYEAVPTY